jgi:hypothetical protein
MNTSGAPIAEKDLGLGTAYERVAIYRLFDRWADGRAIRTACEGPIDGMAGMPGLHLLGLAHQGVSATVYCPDDGALARVRALYLGQGVERCLTTRRIDADAIPGEEFDVLVSYNALPYVHDWRDHLARLFRARARWFFIVVSNPVSYGTYLRRAQRALRGEDKVELFDHECTRRALIEPELAQHGRVLAHDYLDCPWWPDFLLPARKNLAGELLGTLRKAAGRNGSSSGGDPAPRFVFDERSYPFFEGQPGYPETMRSMRLHPTFDRAPEPVARFFGHLHGYLVEKR